MSSVRPDDRDGNGGGAGRRRSRCRGGFVNGANRSARASGRSLVDVLATMAGESSWISTIESVRSVGVVIS